MIKNLFDNWYIDWNYTSPTKWAPSELTYILFVEDNDGRGRRDIILKDEIPIEDRVYIEEMIKGE